jgi:hypothetical protein
MGLADTLKVKGKSALGVWNAPIDGHKGSADRHYCKRCGTPLWVSDEQWPELVHPFASVIADRAATTGAFETHRHLNLLGTLRKCTAGWRRHPP